MWAPVEEIVRAVAVPQIVKTPRDGDALGCLERIENIFGSFKNTVPDLFWSFERRQITGRQLLTPSSIAFSASHNIRSRSATGARR